MTLREFASLRVNQLLERFAQELERVATNSDIHAVHDLRVAIRRLAETLHSMRRLFARKLLRRVLSELRIVMNLAAEVRNRDIALELAVASGVSPETPYCGAMRTEREDAARRLKLLSRKWHKKGIPAKWARLLDATAEPEKGRWRPEESAAGNARVQLPLLAARFLDSGRKVVLESTTPKKRHRFRLRTKRFRYLLEFFRPLYGKKLDLLLKDLRRLQGILGDLNDFAVTQAMVPETDEMGSLLKHLDKQRKKRLVELSRHWKGAFDAPEERRRWQQYLARSAKQPSV